MRIIINKALYKPSLYIVINFHSKIRVAPSVQNIFKIAVKTINSNTGFKLDKVIFNGILEIIINNNADTSNNAKLKMFLHRNVHTIYNKVIIILILGSRRCITDCDG